MKYELKESHRNISNEQLLEDLKRVANMYDTTTLSKKQYESVGKYRADLIARRFSSWDNACCQIGLTSTKLQAKPRYRNATPQDLIADLIRVANLLGVSTLLSNEYALYGNYNRNTFTKVFGSWKNALQRAGLKETQYHKNIPTQELLNNIEMLWIELGRQPTANDIVSNKSKYGIKVYYKRFGSWNKALEYFVQHIDSNSISSEQTTTQQKVDSEYSLKIETTNIDNGETKRNINLRLRFQVMKRDNFKCCICGRSPATTPGLELHIDHIKPWSKGGKTTIDNLQTLCSDCNLGKSNIE